MGHASGTLDSLVARAVAVSPRLRAAHERARAEQARVAPAGARPDPMLMAGVQNLPLSRSMAEREGMTMNMIGVSQVLPLWGKLGLAQRAAERYANAAAAQVEVVAREIRRDVASTYYDIAYADQALRIVDRNRRVLLDLIRAAEVRFSVGGSSGARGTANAPASTSGAMPATAAPSGSTTGRDMSGMPGAGGMPSTAQPSPSTPASTRSPSAMGTGATESMPSMMTGGMQGRMAGGAMQDVLSARVDAARLGADAATLLEERRVAAARLNALLDRPSDADIGTIVIDERIARAAVARSPGAIRFESATLGSRAADSPVPPLMELQRRAVGENAQLRVSEAMIAAQAARVELVARERRPDVEVTLQYGQRSGMSDLLTAMVSLPLPVQRGRKQDQQVIASRADLAALEAEHHDRVLRLKADLARVYSGLERDRTHLALYVKAILPQSHATVSAALAGYQSGTADLVTVLDAQTTVFNYETAYYRALTSFGRSLAELEQLVGGKVLDD